MQGPARSWAKTESVAVPSQIDVRNMVNQRTAVHSFLTGQPTWAIDQRQEAEARAGP